MTSLKDIRNYKGDLRLIRTVIFILSWTLAFFSVTRYMIWSYEYIAGTLGVVSALIFIVINEISKKHSIPAFSIGVYVSMLLFGAYLYILGKDFHFFTWDSLITLTINILLGIGQNLSDKIEE